MQSRSITLCSSLFVTAASTLAQNQRPNIIYIMSDDHAYQCISAYGHAIGRVAPTPNIDRIARNGAIFTNAFVENSISTPSRACLITGLYSHQNGQRQLCEGIDTTKTFFSETLHDAGYQTAMIGKWHMLCEPKGFDYFKIHDGQGTYYNPVFKTNESDGKWIREEGYASELVTEYAIDFMEHRDKNRPFCMLLHHKAPHRSWFPDTAFVGMYDNVEFPLPDTWNDDYSTRGSAAVTQKMEIGKDMEMALDLKTDILHPDSAHVGEVYKEYGRLNPDQKAVIDAYYGQRSNDFNKLHLEGEALRQWKYQTYMRDYMAVIHSVDESVGQVLDYLEKNGLAENTIVIYTSDQGFYMGEHGWFDKRFMYEESLRTPFVMCYPKEIKPGTVIDQMVQNIDYAPTFLDYAGVKKQKQLPGLSFRRLFNEDNPKWRKDIYYHYYDYPAWHLTRKHDGVRDERYKLIHFYGKGGLRAQQENKYQRVPGTVEYADFKSMADSGYITDAPDICYDELYDLKTDPNELHNLINDPRYAKIRKRLQKRLDHYRKSLRIDEY